MVESGRAVPRRQVGAFLVLMGLLGATLGVLAPTAQADPINPGSDIGDFEIDSSGVDANSDGVLDGAANFTVDQVGRLDWAGIADLAERVYFDDPFRPGDDGDDLGYAGGSKEFDRTTWACASDSGDDPPKDDVHYVLAYPDLSIDNATVAFGFVRDTAQGNTNVVIELNRSSMDSCSSVNDRTPGDLILHFDFPGGNDLADLEAYLWDGTAYMPFDVPAGVANATTNASTITVPAQIATRVAAEGLPTSLGARLFGEAAIDLFALQDAIADAGLPASEVLACPGVGFANIRTRSSGSADTSQLHDNFPQIPIDLSDCGSLQLKKVDDLGEPMEGVQFGLFATEAAANDGTPLAQLPATPPQDLVCTTDAAGICTFPKVPPGDYFVNELDLPAGYTADPDLPAPVSIAAFEDVDLSDDDSGACAEAITSEGCEWFVNTLRTGTVVITKAVVDGEGAPLQLTDNTYLDGIAFELQSGGVTVQKRSGGDAACALDLDDPADEPSCTITDLPFGTYDVVEDPTTLPAGLSVGSPPPVTVDEDSPARAEVTYENPADPLNISIDKAGPDTADVGDTISYTFTVGLGDLPFDTVDDVDLQPLTAVAVAEVVSAPDFADRCTSSPLAITDKEGPGPLGDAWLEDGERWTYQCTHLVTAADATDSDGVLLKNRAQVTGTDRYERTDTDTDDHIVTILLPDLQVVKLAADGVDAGSGSSSNETVDAPGTATYTVTVTNIGAGIARNVTLTDVLPSGAWTVSLASPDGSDACPVGGNPASGSFTCTFGNLDPGQSKVVTVSRAISIANDCAAVLLNGVSVATTFGGVDIDPNAANDSSSATVNVRCPDVGVVKTASTTPISAGQRGEWTITLTNNGAGVARDVFLVDAVPAGLTALLLGGPDAASCGLVGHALTCDFGDLPPNDGAPGGPDTRTISVSGLTDPADCGLLPNTATVASSAQGAPYVDSNAGNNSSSAPITVQCPDLDIEKSTDTPTVSAGQDISYDITVTNHGPGEAYDVTLDDPVPVGAGLAWSEGSADCAIAGGVLSCDFGTLTSGGSASVTLTSATTELSCATYPNVATADASNDEAVQDDETVVVQCPDLSIAKTADDSVVTAGDEIGFTISVTNEGPGTAFAVSLDDPLPSGDGVDWSIASGPADCAISSGVLTCTPRDLVAGASFSVHVVSDTDPSGSDCVGGTLLNVATADASNDGAVTAQATTAIECPDVTITKVADDTSVSAGEEIGFTITVANGGSGIARGVTLDDPLPAGVAWTVASQTGGAGCVIDAGTLGCGPLDLAEGGSFSVRVVAPTTEADCALYENTAVADSRNDGAVEASDDSLVKCPGLNITKDADDPETVTAGDAIGFTIEVSNEAGEGVGTALAVQLDDPLPAGDGVSWSIESQTGDAGCTIEDDAPNQALDCGPIDLAPGDAFSVHIVSDTDPSGEECATATLPNLATADGSNTAPVSASDTIAIQCPDVTVTKVADAAVVDAGDDIGFTITVSNAGPGVAADVVIQDPLPGSPGITWTVDPATPGCVILLGVLVCDVGDLAPGTSFEAHVSASTPGALGDPDLVGACHQYDNTATAVVGNDGDETASDSTEVVCPLDISLVKDGPALAHRGDEITYTFDVTNSGAADLVALELADPICDDGTLLRVDDGDGDGTLAVGETWSFECTRLVTATDPDPLPNTALVIGSDARERTTDATDDHMVDLIEPAIEIVKTVDNATPVVDQTVTFTYVVTNTGDTTLYDVEVVDDQLGDVGTIDQLDAGESTTLTLTMLVQADSPLRNVATADGEDVLGMHVSDDDDAVINIIEGKVVLPPSSLPRTGADSMRLAAAGVLLVLGGALLLAGQGAQRRRRTIA